MTWNLIKSSLLMTFIGELTDLVPIGPGRFRTGTKCRGPSAAIVTGGFAELVLLKIQAKPHVGDLSNESNMFSSWSAHFLVFPTGATAF